MRNTRCCLLGAVSFEPWQFFFICVVTGLFIVTIRSVYAFRWLLPIAIRLLSGECVFHWAIPTIKWANHVKCIYQYQQKRKPRQNNYSWLHVEYHLAGLLQGKSIPISTERFSFRMVGSGVRLLYCCFVACYHCDKAIFNWLSKVIPICFGWIPCALLRSVIGLKVSQWDAKHSHSQDLGSCVFPRLAPITCIYNLSSSVGPLCYLRSLWLALVTAVLRVMVLGFYTVVSHCLITVIFALLN